MNVYVPVGAAAGAVTERTEDPEPPDAIAREVGVRATVQPEGTGATVKPTVPAKLLTEVSAIVEVVEAPAATFRAGGEAESEKLGAGGGAGERLFPKSRV